MWKDSHHDSYSNKGRCYRTRKYYTACGLHRASSIQPGHFAGRGGKGVKSLAFTAFAPRCSCQPTPTPTSTPLSPQGNVAIRCIKKKRLSLLSLYIAPSHSTVIGHWGRLQGSNPVTTAGSARTELTSSRSEDKDRKLNVPVTTRFLR